MGRTPVRTRKSKAALVKSSLELNADSKFTRCPEGHPLPHKTEKGRCTPLSCATKADLPRLRTDKDDAPEEVRLAKVKGDEEIRTKIQATRRQVWQDFLQIPVDLKGADAEKHADDELMNMLPFAVGVLKKQLLFGTEEQQERAANKVLDANGKGKRDAAGNTAPTMIIQFGGDGKNFNLPWRSGTVQVVEGSKGTPALPASKDPNEKV